MASFNLQILSGVVGTVNELRGEDTKAVLSFSVATSDYVGAGRGENGTNYATTWHDVTSFGKQAASLAKRLGKGDIITVSGPRVKETYTKKDGTPGEAWRVKANEAVILKSKAGTGDATAQASATTTSAGIADQDVPF